MPDKFLSSIHLHKPRRRLHRRRMKWLTAMTMVFSVHIGTGPLVIFSEHLSTESSTKHSDYSIHYYYCNRLTSKFVVALRPNEP